MFSRSFLRSSQFKYLGAFYLHSLVRLFAVSIFQLFSGLYIFQIMRGLGLPASASLAITALFFSILYLATAISIVPALWLISKKGLKFAVFWGNMFLIGFYLVLYLGRLDPIFLFIAAILGGLEIALYWIAYHIYFSELTDDKKQGEELSIGAVLSAVVLIAGPAFGGLMISFGGYGSVFLAVMVLLLVAVFPLKYLPKKKDTVSIDVLKIARALNPKKELKSYLSLMGIGAGGVTNEIFWPIYIFPILMGFAGVGLMGSLSAIVASIASIVVGLLIDKVGAKSILRFISPIDSLLWVVKALIVTGNQVYLVSLFRGVTNPGQVMSLDTLLYERARHEDLVSFIVQREVGLAAARFIFMFLVGVLFWFGMPLTFVLIITAILVLFTPLYPQTKLPKSD